MWTTALQTSGTTRMVASATPGILAKDREGSWLRIDPNWALLAAGNGEVDGDPNGEVTEDVTAELVEEPDEALDPV